ncbi:MAG: alpha/beta hydrolase family protein [Chthoniobacterales bacterium]|nr:alpha/beta hydrolase family protein [Chthoniobacterales bacterium]
MTLPKQSHLRGLRYQIMDSIMYGMMNYVQWQLRHEVSSQEALETYLKEYACWDRASYFSVPPMKTYEMDNNILSWESPISTSFVENNRVRALFFPASHKKSEYHPTLIILHALMSTSDHGYRRIAAHMNQRGWNVLFPHLPFHYSRRPKDHANGALTITTDLIRTAQTVRQAVQEIRQLMVWLRIQGSERIGLLATSYGGWVASLLLSLECVDFAVLLQPIIDLNLALFKSPLARMMGSSLRAHGVTHEHLDRHAHLTGPSFATPLTSSERIALIGGTYDCIAPPEQLKYFCSHWNVRYEEVAQGHFGYQAMKKALLFIDIFCH